MYDKRIYIYLCSGQALVLRPINEENERQVTTQLREMIPKMEGSVRTILNIGPHEFFDRSVIGWSVFDESEFKKDETAKEYVSLVREMVREMKRGDNWQGEEGTQ